ncbi:MAG TPA: ATP-dependent DNA helicase RecG [Candidatus Acidoferrales bacterium]|jgi:ATP-dependent DNA helicase RecG|nr:ATP-dependent DNA helicase RecG [Candidatus Acidoferrales bacterium]
MSVTPTTELMYLKGVGPRRAEILAKRGLRTFEDLLGYLPFRYEDRIRFATIRDIAPGTVYTIRAQVLSGSLVRYTRASGGIYHLLVRDETGSLPCKFFHGQYLEKRFKAGQGLVLHGRAELDAMRPGRIEMINPEYELLGEEGADSTEVGRIVPIYEAIGGIGSRTMRRVVYLALQEFAGALADPLPAEILARYKFPSRRDAIQFVHFPPVTESVAALNSFRSQAHLRLIFEEFFFYQLSVAMRKKSAQQRTGIAFRVREPAIREAIKRVLPFKPTDAQKRALGEIAADLERGVPMNRLLQGDVGSGKTIVAFEAATIVVENGYQAALMAPTEILAVQHFLAAGKIFARAGYRVELLISGMKASEKKAALERVRSGESQLVVGTHALLEPQVEFKRLGLVIVDEQHRFGVLQRKGLMEKGTAPDVLVMTATPIPRTLSLTLYGDLDISVIDQMPPGRVPIVTRVSSEENLPGVWDFLRREIAAGRQTYVVYPVIEQSKSAESERSLKAAIVEFEKLRSQIFPNRHVGLLHGRMKSAEKEDVMDRFRRHEIDILVATTVIEVGVDVPNATVMVIEHANRFGLSQLHQLRGRIGRGGEKGTCILIAPRNPGDDARVRLETMVRTTDGFEIAETDLKLRGPGEFFGTRQHGELGFHVANPIRDFDLLEQARREALSLVEPPEAAPARQRLLAGLPAEWQRRYQLASVG